MISKAEEQLAFVSSLMTVQDRLCTDCFTPAGNVRTDVAEKLLGIADLVQKKLLDPICTAKIEDIVLCGNLCGYLYDSKSDLDLAIVVNDFAGDAKVSDQILKLLNASFPKRGFYFDIGDHHVDYFLILQSDLVRGNYSLVQNKWLCLPQKREFSFSPAFCYQQYGLLSAEIHHQVRELEKTDTRFLTSESCRILADYLTYLKKSALAAKCNHPEHEYSLHYTLFRCLKHFGTYRHFRDYIRDSENFITNGE